MRRDGANRLATDTLLVLLALYAVFMVFVQTKAIAQPWLMGDWLINYSAGFVRRGLVGELARRLYLEFGLNPVTTIVAIKAAAYGVFAIALFALASRSGVGLVEIALIVSPAALLFEVNDLNGSGRKEVVLLALFVVYVLGDSMRPAAGQPFYRRWQFWYLLVVLPMATLIHEGLFLFFPFVLVYEYVTRADSERPWVVFAIPYLVALSVFALAYGFRGDVGTAQAICSSLLAMSFNERVCTGAVEALGYYPVVIHVADVVTHVVLAILAFGPLLWYAHAALERTRWRMFLPAAAVASACTVPLYAVSEDWGRWMHVTWMLLFVTVLVAKPWGSGVSTGNRRSTLLMAVALAVYVAAWRLPHWIHFPMSPWRFF